MSQPLPQLAAIALCPLRVRLEAADTIPLVANYALHSLVVLFAGHTCEVVAIPNCTPASSTMTYYPTGSKPTGGDISENGGSGDHGNNGSNGNNGNGSSDGNGGSDDHENKGNNGGNDDNKNGANGCKNNNNINSGNNVSNGGKNVDGHNDSNVNKPPTVTGSGGARFEVGVVAGIFAAAWLVAVAL